MIIDTGILHLREMTHDDFEALYAILSDPIAMQYYPKPHTPEMTRDWIENNIKRYHQHGFGLWAIVHTEEKRVIGDCGLTYQHVDGIDELEIGYHILRTEWGKGYASQCAIACRDYVFDKLKRERVISWMNPKNMASRRVAEKVGMSLEKETISSKGLPAVVYSMSLADRL